MDRKQKGRGTHLIEVAKKSEPSSDSGDRETEPEPSTSSGSGEESGRRSRRRGERKRSEPSTSGTQEGGRGRGYFMTQLAKQSQLKASEAEQEPSGEAYGPSSRRVSGEAAEAIQQLDIGRPVAGGGVGGGGGGGGDKEEEKDESDRPPVVRMGSSGERVRIYANYITLKTDPGKGVFEFEVKFNPAIDYVAFRFQLLTQHFNIKKGVRCYDGGDKLFMPEKITSDQINLMGNHPQDGSPVTTTIIFKRQMRLKECSQLYNILFNNCAKVLDLTRLGRHHYNHRANRFIPQHKLEVWPGYITSVEEFEGGIHLCCDIKHRVLRTETAYDILSNIIRTDSKNFRARAVKELLGQCILTRYNNHMYRIDDIAWDQTPMTTFEAKGTRISFLEYYKRQYNIDIKDVNQPLLVHNPKKRSKLSRVCLIPELSHMTGLTDQMRKDIKVMKEVATFTRVTPSQRQFGLKEFLGNIKKNPRAQEMLKEWGLKISEDPVSLEARVLPPEDIYFRGTESGKSSDRADWSKFIQSKGVLRAVSINKWVLLFTGRDRKLAEELAQSLREVGPAVGIRILEPTMVCLRDDRIETYIKALKENVNPSVQIAVCLCGTPREDRYSAIKKLCCRDLPIPTQVINSSTISRQRIRLKKVIENVALQMNNKLGGASWAVHIPLKNCMICGIDSYHDLDKNGHSVGAFVASIDSRYTQWFSRASLQEPRQELLDGLVVSFTSALKKYLEVNKMLPDRIVIFRDGVGDGQLATVQQYEVRQFLEACKMVSKEYRPKFSFVVVQKRINTKIFVEAGGNLANPSSGCILDHTITRRNFYDFFLVSQFVTCGTATPSHYIVLYDNSDLKPDHMQRLAYKFCHMYYNWPGTIRVPAPCQYAHKLAFLVGQNIKGSPSQTLEDKLYYL